MDKYRHFHELNREAGNLGFHLEAKGIAMTQAGFLAPSPDIEHTAALVQEALGLEGLH